MKTVVLASLAGLALASVASAQISIVNNIPGSFVDITGTGTSLGLNGDDSSAALAVPAGFGNAVLAAGAGVVSTNGRYNLAPGSTAFSNTALVTGAGNQGYYPYWDDLRTDTAGSNVYSQIVGDAFIVQWNATFFNSGAPIRMQIQIFNAAGQLAHGGALAQYLYAPSTAGALGYDGASATVGAIDDQGNIAEWSFNTPGSVIPGQTVLSIVQVPAPGAAAMLGLGGLIVGRRRR